MSAIETFRIKKNQHIFASETKADDVRSYSLTLGDCDPSHTNNKLFFLKNGLKDAYANFDNVPENKALELTLNWHPSSAQRNTLISHNYAASRSIPTQQLANTTSQLFIEVGDNNITIDLPGNILSLQVFIGDFDGDGDEDMFIAAGKSNPDSDCLYGYEIENLWMNHSKSTTTFGSHFGVSI